MKLIITGATGLVATELLRQSLRTPSITSVVALARKPVSPPSDITPADATKLQSVVLTDYERYPDDVRRQLAGADACIWCVPFSKSVLWMGADYRRRTVAVTPTKAQSYAFEEVTRICQTCTLAGIGAMVEAGQKRPFRFLYMSGQNSERDQSKRPVLLPAYCKMRVSFASLLGGLDRGLTVCGAGRDGEPAFGVCRCAAGWFGRTVRRQAGDHHGPFGPVEQVVVGDDGGFGGLGHCQEGWHPGACRGHAAAGAGRVRKGAAGE